MLWNCKADSGGKQGLILAQGAILQCWKFCLQVVIDFFFLSVVSHIYLYLDLFIYLSLYMPHMHT